MASALRTVSFLLAGADFADSAVAASHPDEHHLLGELADRGEPVRQRRLLAPDLPADAVQHAQLDEGLV